MTIYGAELPYPTAGDRIVDDEEYEHDLRKFSEALCGSGPFWPRVITGRVVATPDWDNEPDLKVAAAVASVLAMPNATPAERWTALERKLLALIDQYAQMEAK